MSRSELHNWECAIERLSGDNADKMLAIAQDIYNTAFVRGKNYMSLEQQPCEDYISIKTVLDAIDIYADNLREYISEDLPFVTPQPKIGEWIYTGDYITEGMLKCSECGFEHDVSERFLYCPKCGIKMEVEE
ncbi:MAG: hypothetical protein IKF42_06320 [Mogibacterium sp.]|nr:hypothetical protein [Mogibacterium sp.]